MEILIFIVGGIVGFFVKDYLPGYARQKGENLATKEDIEIITKKIESVKADVNFKKEQERQFVDTKQKLLMDFYDEITTFYYESLAVNFGDFPMDSGKSLFEYQTTFYKSVAEIMKSYQRLVIFLPPESSLLKFATEITQSTIGTRKILKSHFGEIKITAIQEENAHLEKRQELDRAVKEADEANTKLWGRMKPEVESFRRSFQSLLKEMNNYVSLGSNET